jgi:hypothetical protein
VLLIYGLLWVLLGFVTLYLLQTMDDEREFSSLAVLQYGAWMFGGCLILVAGYRLHRDSKLAQNAATPRRRTDDVG